MTKSCLLLACGALAAELSRVVQLNRWDHVRIRCLPPELHNRPDRIPEAVRMKLTEYRDRFDTVFVAYGDCGTGGKLDAVLDEFGVERLPGAHCYEFYTGAPDFGDIAEAEAGTFYVTDFLVRHFERIVRRGLGLDGRPELATLYFGNYRRLLYLAQEKAAELQELAESHARFLGLDYAYRFTGTRHVEHELEKRLSLQCQ